jgi:hypothetical protein
MTDEQTTAPPHGEEIHLPGPSIKPLLLTVGLTMLLLGLVGMWPVALLGLILLVWVMIAWIGDTRRDIAELPAEHH